MSSPLRGTLYDTSEQVSSHLHRRSAIAMTEHVRCRLSASVSVNAIDESEIINPVDHSGGFGGCVLARGAPPEEGVFFPRGAGGKPAKPAHPASNATAPENVSLPDVPWCPLVSLQTPPYRVQRAQKARGPCQSRYGVPLHSRQRAECCHNSSAASASYACQHKSGVRQCRGDVQPATLQTQ
jgi:hypothetical protein